MRLRILLPTQVLVDASVNKIIAQAEDGDFCLLPRHIDFVSALTPGVLSFRDPSGKESYAAIDEGVLVKCEQNVYVSTLNAVRGENISELQALVEKHFLELDEHERKARTALARLEAGTLRGFRELQERLNG
ncbi:F0F1 ATP synthase subunit epsilon [Kineobactrum sediminis]|uniref:ATP synthase epsilon chain n=2 Tax=Kineobactrum sediminis TaxID=1905677 RepID=A0A2N5Y2E4_9GAMM|nr:F0F1 ATP synthase subunit epsilon [Kineobactrum sediminis]